MKIRYFKITFTTDFRYIMCVVKSWAEPNLCGFFPAKVGLRAAAQLMCAHGTWYWYRSDRSNKIFVYLGQGGYWAVYMC